MKKKMLNFVKKQKLKKSIEGYSERLVSGDQLLMFNNKYKVMSTKKSGQVLLKDSRDLMMALPEDKLLYLMKKGEIKKLYKSNGKGGSTLTPQGFIVEQKKPSARMQGQVDASSGKGRVAPLGTVHNGRMKVSMNPSKWVDVQSGHSHDHHTEGEQHGDLHHQDDLTQAHRFHRTIMLKAHPDDHEKLKSMINEWHGHRRRYQNIIEVRKGMTEGGKALPKWLNEKANKINDEATGVWQKFEQAYKASIKKKMSRS